MGQSKIPEDKLLPLPVIEAATREDPDAMKQVLAHFEGYIAFMSVRIFYDEFGQSYRCVDYELKRRIENKLADRIVQKFKPI